MDPWTSPWQLKAPVYHFKYTHTQTQKISCFKFFLNKSLEEGERGGFSHVGVVCESLTSREMPTAIHGASDVWRMLLHRPYEAAQVEGM